MTDLVENGPIDLTNIEPDKINKLDNILWLRAEIERLQAENKSLAHSNELLRATIALKEQT